jgi:hypothetical protein
MTEGWASLAGCAVKVACVGAVATYEEYRGKGMASQLFACLCDKAKVDGVDIMMISGGKRLYRAAGAADVGCDLKARVDESVGAALAESSVSLRPFTHADLSVYAVAYGRKTAHFIRASEDWESILRTRGIVLGEQQMWTVLRDGLVCAYIVSVGPNKDGKLWILEFAGDEAAIGGCARTLLEKTKSSWTEYHLQRDDEILRERFAQAGAKLEPVSSLGTLLLIDFPRLMERLYPLLEGAATQAGFTGICFAEDNGAFVFECGGQSETVTSRIEAAQRIFGHPDLPPWDGPLGRLFPVPSLWYGLNYI